MEAGMAKVDVNSEMTGTVWKILVEIGQKVDEEEPVMLIESMKMEIPVFAPEAGAVAEILVAEGDMVEDGGLVMRLDT
jgi:acetyl-CoA carboxylase biotin carboxyl carrier protein